MRKQQILNQCKKRFICLVCGKAVQFVAMRNHMERSFVTILKSSSPFSSQALQEEVEVRVSKVENKLEKMLKQMVRLL